MEDDKKTEQESPPTPEQPVKPLAVQMVNAVIDGAAAIAKSVVMDTAERMANKAEKTKVGKAVVTPAKKAKKAIFTASKKKAPKKAAAKKSAVKKASPKKVAAKKSKPAAKKTTAKRATAKKPLKQPARKAARKSSKKTTKKSNR
jgi:hypothetical protein